MPRERSASPRKTRVRERSRGAGRGSPTGRVDTADLARVRPLGRRDRAACAERRACSLFIGVFTPWPTRTSSSRRGASPPSRPAAPAQRSRTSPRRCCGGCSTPTGRYPDVIAPLDQAPRRHQHAPRRALRRARPQGHPGHDPSADDDPPLRWRRLQDAAPRGQSRPSTAGSSPCATSSPTTTAARSSSAPSSPPPRPPARENENAVLHCCTTPASRSRSSTRRSTAPTSSPTSSGQTRR